MGEGARDADTLGGKFRNHCGCSSFDAAMRPKFPRLAGTIGILGALGLFEFQTLFKFTAGHATPVLHAVRTAKTHTLLKSMWNIDFDDDTMMVPACVKFCLQSRTVF